ncbi:MAG: T9SS type A sorting domain-containing protein, partial [Flavobacterium sp.]|nr:T9SS type A sorting domain-containing protein [Flavobacterium sp.]
SVDMRNMQTGIYLVTIATENGTETATVIKK